MVGVCGVIGRRTRGPDRMLEGLQWDDDETEAMFVDEDVVLAWSFHDLLAGESPARTDTDDVLMWVWGDVYGHFGQDGYVPRARTGGASEWYVADLYDERGGQLDFADLNGDFLAILYDRSDRSVTFVTDRVGSRPVFHAEPADGGLVFASGIQSLVTHPDVDVQFDLEYLYEYLVLRRVFGVRTPLEGVEEFPPASAVTVALDDGSIHERQYWRPTHRPTDESFSTYADRFDPDFGFVQFQQTDTVFHQEGPDAEPDPLRAMPDPVRGCPDPAGGCPDPIEGCPDPVGGWSSPGVDRPARGAGGIVVGSRPVHPLAVQADRGSPITAET